MATLVLSTVGTALGGPVGSAIGALIGQSIDQQLLGSSSRGPRLGDLKVQSSSYGTQIPRVYGTMRVAGTIIWATDLVESSEMTGVKGQPDTTYSYSVSFAVALSSRSAVGIKRIWADGKLLRGESGDFKVSTDFRFYNGSEDQVVDPLIASVEGVGSTPAYRGLALAVFENLELAEYGNRIPFLTFELLGDDGQTTIGAILGDASGGLIEADAPETVGGYAAYGQSIRSAVTQLIDCYATKVFDNGDHLGSPTGDLRVVGDDEFGNSADGDRPARLQREQAPARMLPAALRLGFYDAALDYQSGEARATVAEKSGSEESRELAASISAGDAKSLAQKTLARTWAQRDKLTLSLPPRYMGLQPGARLDLELSPRSWNVEQCAIEGFVVTAELRPSWDGAAQVAADSGRANLADDIVVEDVTVALFDVPNLVDQTSSTPTLLLAASAPTPGWKKRGVEIVADQQSFQAETARRKTVLGHALAGLPDGDPFLIDDINALEVELIDPDHWLVSCDDEALANGNNLAVLGSELLQFGQAEPIGEGKFRLRRFLRGRAGTEWAMQAHTPGEPFALLQLDTLRAISVPSWLTGTTVVASPRNVSGRRSDSLPLLLNGESLRPRSPAVVRAEFDEAGNLDIRWTRRTRSAWGWSDGMDAPLCEGNERYRIDVSAAAGAVELEAAQPNIQITAGEISALGGGIATIEVRQVGDYGLSRAAETTATIS